MTAAAMRKAPTEAWSSAQARLETWNRMYERLVAYRRCHGHFFVPRRHPDPGLRALGRWAGEQRVAHNKGELDPHRFELLAIAGFPFDYHAERWESMYSQLQRFRNRYGDCHVPFKERRWGSLARWVQVQRRNYRAGKLSEARIRRLERLGFAWRLPRGRQAPATILRRRPSVFLLRLETFRDVHGHVRVPTVCPEDEGLPRLCELAARFARSGELCTEACALLASWNFDIEDPLAPSEEGLLAFIGGFEGFYEALVAFRAERGHARVPVRAQAAHARLARAAAITRRLAREAPGRLPPRWRERLDRIGFDFATPDPELPTTAPDRIL